MDVLVKILIGYSLKLEMKEESSFDGSYDIIIEEILFVNAIEQEDDPNNLTLKICLNQIFQT